MLVVMALVGLIVGIGLPNLRRSSIRAEMLGEVNMVKQAIPIARINAIKGGNTVVAGFVGTALYSETGGTLRIWVDGNGDEQYTAGEEVIREWRISNDVEVRLDPSEPLRDLGTAVTGEHGVVFRADGVTFAADGTTPVGTGAVQLTDPFDNTIRVSFLSGAGSVRTAMLIPGTTDGWDSNLRYWRYD
jgi:Tfp pilus assembly protein FimT